MSFIKELKRRNVIRVAIAYAIAAWLLIEITATTFPILKLPEWSVTLVTVFVLIGFPLALILAWAFELTPEGLKKEKDVDRSESITHITGRKLDFIIIAVLTVALVMFAVERFFLLPSSVTAGDSAQEVIATEVQQSIAVLPFVNMSPDPDQEYFSDGLSEEILNLLAKIPGLKVIGRTSSFAFKGKNEDLRSIGEALGVKTVLEGSVRKAGDQVRITAQLIDTSDGAHIWSETYDRTLNNIFAVQDDVAAAIIDALQIHVGTNPTRGRPTENTEAYALFLKARASANATEWPDAEDLLLQAIELDPEFAEAYEQLAFTYWNLAGGRRHTFVSGQRHMGEAAAKALAIDPDLVIAQALYKSGNLEAWSLLGEMEAFEYAVRKQPNDPTILDVMSWNLLSAGYLRDAVNLSKRLVEIEPLSLGANVALGYALFAVGQSPEEAGAAMKIADQLGHEDVKAQIGDMYLIEKQDDIAIPYIEAFLQQQNTADIFRFRELVTAARDPATGQAYLDRRIPEIAADMGEERAIEFDIGNGELYLLFGFLDRYYEIIFDLGPTDSSWSDVDITLYNGTVSRRGGFTAHPKYLELAEMIGMIDVWEQRGPPDFCEKVDGEWVCE